MEKKPSLKKTLMILGGSLLQLPAIKKAKEMGLNVVVVDMNPDAIGFKEENVIKEVISTIDIPKVIDAAKKHHVDGILTIASDMPMRTVAAVAKELHLVGIDDETAYKATDKYEMRLALQKNNIPIPLFYRASSFDEFLKYLSKFHGKVISKPADNSGSRGIFLIDDYSKAKEAFSFSLANSRNGYVLLEEYMIGPEVSVETMSINGKCIIVQITDKITTGAPHFVEMGHSQPSCLNEDIKNEIKSIVKKAVKAIGIKDGPSHTEVIVTKTGPKIVEIGARLGGDCITTHLVPLSTGVNLVECCIKVALGCKPTIKKTVDKGSAILFYKQKKGIVKSITGIEEAYKIDGIEEVFCSCSNGSTIPDIVNSSSRVCFVIGTADDAFSAIKRCKIALSKIDIETF